MSENLAALRAELNYDKTSKCVQCGYCLPACPTYLTMGKETHSPRGRINLVKMAGEGKIKDLSVLEEPLDLCLGCRACETVCPTGVEYGAILESARAAVTRRKKFSVPVKALRNTLFKKVFPSRRAMKLIGNAMWLYEKTGVQKLARKSGLMEKLPAHLGEFEKIMPAPVSPGERSSLPAVTRAKGEKKYTVAFFVGCVMDAMFRRINHLSVQLLAEVGCDVIVVEKQTCCGALHAHTGELDESRKLAKQNIVAFEQAEVDFIVNNAGGCGAMMVEYDHLLAGEPEWAERARQFAGKTKDISQVLALCGGIKGQERPAERVTYQRSCHMTNVQKVTEDPLGLIKGLPNVELVEMKEANMCCGSAGIYNIVQYDASMEILDYKMKHVKDTQTTTIVTTNPGCLLQMKLGIERENLNDRMRAVHLVEYLAERCGINL
ncbi:MULTISPECIES: (Fe-S)-binding protein [Brevibacillus]|jgi:glycolate oxidase iron-sulfur subunit|uniref:Glycolate oxidase iron-sulfur subunit n=1 Tax=Brevibacillus borstelensis AK1 TaxID=1300222 RepID=M8DZZ3_9BACL|nr:(Fe-S)-binding protein [Brevibacillus borstelensis]EMT52601.1 glycolate oxidase iron-sulfur subunit [Brevibacillus borstelensis AK1]KKX55117.1 glycolate oxidase [Brevibacillus borstelensis cifa_chp40]MCC0563836.1 (Fe-S)-binding protein [Brevibacillus borstelensis]MCM3472045.1 (Fe-S)-binding protein [Brevibacillus borstelensis]MCM3560151.1 (Fe-S)-binding protein [Brevibacillus borstelensis]